MAGYPSSLSCPLPSMCSASSCSRSACEGWRARVVNYVPKLPRYHSIDTCRSVADACTMSWSALSAGPELHNLGQH